MASDPKMFTAAVIPTVLSPGRVSQALASVGPPAGSNRVRHSCSTGFPASTQGPRDSNASNGALQPKTPSPSRISATTTTTIVPTSSQAATSLSPSSPPLPAPSVSDAAYTTTTATRNITSPGTSPVTLAPARSLSRRVQMSSDPAPRLPSSNITHRSQLLSEGSANSGISLYQPPRGNHSLSGASQRSIRIRDRDRDRSLSNGYFGSNRVSNASFTATSTMDGGAIGAGLAAPAIDMTRLATIQRLLLELYDTEDEEASTPGSPRGESPATTMPGMVTGGGTAGPVNPFQTVSSKDGFSSIRRRRKTSDSDVSLADSTVGGFRTVASLMSRGSMHNWQPAATAVRGTLEEHQRRMRERHEVNTALRRWTEQVLSGTGRQSSVMRLRDIAQAASVRFAEPPYPESDASSPTKHSAPAPDPSVSFPGEGEGEESDFDPDQVPDIEEERRLTALKAAPPNPRGLGAQLRAHFLAVVDEEMTARLAVIRARWDEERAHETEELKQLRDSYRDLRRQHADTKDALDRANTRVDLMRMQMKGHNNHEKADKASGGPTGGPASPEPASPYRRGPAPSGNGDGEPSSAATPSTVTGPSETRGGRGSRTSRTSRPRATSISTNNSASLGAGRTSSVLSTIPPAEGTQVGVVMSGVLPSGSFLGPSASVAGGVGGGGIEDELHDRLRSVGSRRPTSMNGDTGGGGMNAEVATTITMHVEAAAALKNRLQEAENQISKLKYDKANLEQQITVAKNAAKETSSAPSGSGGSKVMDLEGQIFRLKQEKANLEKQLVAAQKGAAATGAARKSASTGSGGPRGRGSVKPGKDQVSTAAAVAAEAATTSLATAKAESERLQKEVAAALAEAELRAREAADRAAEVEKLRKDLAQSQTTVSLALQHITAAKDAVALERDRADRAVAAAAAVEAAAAQAAAAEAERIKEALRSRWERAESGEGAGSGVAATAEGAAERAEPNGVEPDGDDRKGDGQGDRQGSGEEGGGRKVDKDVEALIERLARERDLAHIAASEARQQVREMAQTLTQQQNLVVELREQALQQQLKQADPGIEARERVAAVAEAAVAISKAKAEAAKEQAEAEAAVADVAAAAVAAMRSLGLRVASLAVVKRQSKHRRTSSGASSGSRHHSSDGYAASFPELAAAAAGATAGALIPAMMLELRRRLPALVEAVEAELQDEAAMAMAETAQAIGMVNASEAAAAVAAAAAETAARQGGDAASAAAAGATAAAATVASALADLLRTELLMLGRGGTLDRLTPNSPSTAASSGLPSPAGSASPRPFNADPAVDGADVGANGALERVTLEGAVMEHVDHSKEQYPDHHRLYVIHPDTTLTTAAAAPAPAADLSPPPPATTSSSQDYSLVYHADGLTFVPLGVRSAERPHRLRVCEAVRHASSVAAAHAAAAAAKFHPDAVIAAVDDVPRSPQGLPHHTPYFDSAAAAVVAAVNDSTPGPYSVSVSAPRIDRFGRMKGAFAQLHSHRLPRPPPPVAEAHQEGAESSDLDPDVNAWNAGMVVTASAPGGVEMGTTALQPPTSPGATLPSRTRTQHAPNGRYASEDGAALPYVGPDLGAVLQVGRVSPATARAAGAGRGAISPEALGPSTRDRALAAVQLAPLQRPHSATPTSQIAIEVIGGGAGSSGSGSGGRNFGRPWRPSSAMLPPVGARESGVIGSVLPEGAAAVGTSGGVAMLQGLGAKVRPSTANPQKGIPLWPRSCHNLLSSARGGRDSITQGYPGSEEEGGSMVPVASVSSRPSGVCGLTPMMREFRLHTGAAGVEGGLDEGYVAGGDVGPAGGSSSPELPASGPELAALARELMAAQERAVRELEEAMSVKRELAQEVLSSREQWLEEARRSRALQLELDNVKRLLQSLGIGELPWQGGGWSGEGAGGGRLTPSGRSSPGVSPQGSPRDRDGGSG